MLWLWRKELAYLLVYVFIAAGISHFTGYFSWMLVAILAGFLIYHAFLLARLEQWLRAGAPGKSPNVNGVWGDVYYHFSRIKRKDKQRKKKLTSIIEQFRRSTDVLPDAAIVVGPNYEIQWSNQFAKLMLGIKKSDRGQRIDNLIRAPEFVQFLRDPAEKKTVTMLSPVDSAIYLMFRMVSYDNQQKLIIAHDVTQQRNLELMRKNFVDNVSHELRTPLTVIKGYLETLQDSPEAQSPFITKSLVQMEAQTDRMQYLVNDLLLLARLETKKQNFECVDIPALITEIWREKQSIDPKPERIRLYIETDWKIMGEEQELRSAFSNLIGNAIKYSPEDKPIIIRWKEKAAGLVFEVIDQGEGIAENEIQHITKRFYRVDVKRTKKLPGTGLGLAIVKHVIKRHEAELDIQSQLGQGSRFRCIFPLNRRCH